MPSRSGSTLRRPASTSSLRYPERDRLHSPCISTFPNFLRKTPTGSSSTRLFVLSSRDRVEESPRLPRRGGPFLIGRTNRHGEILANRDARREFEDAWTGKPVSLTIAISTVIHRLGCATAASWLQSILSRSSLPSRPSSLAEPLKNVRRQIPSCRRQRQFCRFNRRIQILENSRAIRCQCCRSLAARAR